jgi:hypothetical protein
MIRRCFSFGCSFVRWHWPSWADLIGVNYDEYYNFGNPGVSNSTIMNRFIEVDSKFNFQSNTDLILISASGFGRFNFLREINGNKSWFACGELEKYSTHDGKMDSNLLDILEFLKTKFWKKSFGVYYSWIALNSMKKLLTSRNIEHKIIMGLDNRHYISDSDLLDTVNEQSMIEEIYNLLDVKESLQEFFINNKFKKYGIDDHPTPETNLKFIEKYFPELVSNQSKEMCEYSRKNFMDTNLKHIHCENWMDKLSPLRSVYRGDLYGNYH